jgi:hypothetical protein
VTLVTLVIGDVLEYRAGHGLGGQTLLALFDLQSGLFVMSWGISAGFLVLAPVTGWLRHSARAIAALSLIGVAMPKGTPGQLAAMLFLIWVLVVSIASARRAHAAERTTPAAASA